MTQNAEQVFIELCDQAGIRWRRIPTAEKDREKRPDYEIEVSGNYVVVEVKQFDPNREEKKALADLEKQHFAAFPTRKPGGRVRKAIDKAAPQLKALSKGKLPTVVAVLSNVLDSHVDPYDIMTAMKGLDTVPVTVPKDSNVQPSFGDPKSGPDKRMTTNHNTTISAVAVIRKAPEAGYVLDVYHNNFAANPIDPAWLRRPDIRHWKIPEGSASSLISWESI